MKNLMIPLALIKTLADGKFHSGEHIGQQLDMSRAAINKHIQTLRSWGLDIYTVTGKGYRIGRPLQLLDQQKISSILHLPQVDVLTIIDSTNQYLLNHIDKLSSGYACVAEYQYAGRGRRGRQWFSPFGSNLYLSMFWKLEQGPAATMGLSLVVGIVMAETLMRLGAKNIKVKWPNDLYVTNRKLAGILIELTGKTGDCANVVIGTGINLSMQNPDNTIVDQQWVNLEEVIREPFDRNILVAELINSLRDNLVIFESEGLKPFLARWNSIDNFIDKPVKLIIGDKVIRGIERGIDIQGGLLLEQNGEIKSYIGGEISLRAE